MTADEVREFKVGDLVTCLSEQGQPIGVVVMAIDPRDDWSVAVRWQEGFDYLFFGYLVSPENPEGQDYHTYSFEDLELVEDLEEAEAEVLKSISESARRRNDGEIHTQVPDG